MKGMSTLTRGEEAQMEQGSQKMDPSDFYRRMMLGLHLSGNQQQSIDIQKMRSMQQSILDSQENKTSVFEKYKDCEIIDAEFEVIKDEPKLLEKA